MTGYDGLASMHQSFLKSFIGRASTSGDYESAPLQRGMRSGLVVTIWSLLYILATRLHQSQMYSENAESGCRGFVDVEFFSSYQTATATAVTYRTYQE